MMTAVHRSMRHRMPVPRGHRLVSRSPKRVETSPASTEWWWPSLRHAPQRPLRREDDAADDGKTERGGDARVVVGRRGVLGVDHLVSLGVGKKKACVYLIRPLPSSSSSSSSSSNHLLHDA